MKSRFRLQLIPLFIQVIYTIKRTIKEKARKLNLEANFKSKPFINDYGSSMHIHFNFLENNDVETHARILCHYLPLTITAFLPKEEDYKRFHSRFMAPTHISYGSNNRTTLIYGYRTAYLNGLSID
jgi:glutamine synthetase